MTEEIDPKDPLGINNIPQSEQPVQPTDPTDPLGINKIPQGHMFKGVSLDSQYDEGLNFGYDQQRYRAEKQPFSHKLGNMLARGVYKGSLSMVENLGYMFDLPDVARDHLPDKVLSVMGIANTLDDADRGYTNWLSEGAKSLKQQADQHPDHQVYRMNPEKTWDTADPAFYMQSVESLIDSGIGFALPGGLVGKGAQALTAMMKIGALPAAIVESLGTAAATNYAESKMMSIDLFDKAYKEALSRGVDKKLAQEVAADEANKFIWHNKVNILSDMFELRALFGLGGAAKEGFMKAALKEAASEGLEEVSSGAIQHEGEYRAKRRTGGDVSRDRANVLDRGLAYSASPQALLEFAIGAAGGVVQGRMVEGLSSAMNSIAHKAAALQQARETGDAPAIEKAETSLLSSLVWRNAEEGKTEELFAQIEEMAPDEQSAAAIREKAEGILRDYKTAANYANKEELYPSLIRQREQVSELASLKSQIASLEQDEMEVHKAKLDSKAPLSALRKQLAITEENLAKEEQAYKQLISKERQQQYQEEQATAQQEQVEEMIQSLPDEDVISEAEQLISKSQDADPTISAKLAQRKQEVQQQASEDESIQALSERTRLPDNPPAAPATAAVDSTSEQATDRTGEAASLNEDAAAEPGSGEPAQAPGPGTVIDWHDQIVAAARTYHDDPGMKPGEALSDWALRGGIDPRDADASDQTIKADIDKIYLSPIQTLQDARQEGTGLHSTSGTATETSQDTAGTVTGEESKPGVHPADDSHERGGDNSTDRQTAILDENTPDIQTGNQDVQTLSEDTTASTDPRPVKGSAFISQGWEYVLEKNGEVWEPKTDEQGRLVAADNVHKIDFDYLNDPGSLQAGSEVFFEVDLSDPFAQGKWRTVESMAVQIVSYQGEERHVVGVLPDAAKITGQLHEGELLALRQQVFEQVTASGQQTGIIKTGIKTKVARKSPGYNHYTTEEYAPHQVTSGPLLFAIGMKELGRPYLEKAGVDVPMASEAKVQAGRVYQLLPIGDGTYFPFPALARLLKDLPDLKQQALDIISKTTASNLKDSRRALDEIVTLKRSMSLKADGFYLNGKKTGTGDIASLLDGLQAQVSVKQINQGDYNGRVSKEGRLKINVHPFVHSHSARLVLSPVEQAQQDTGVKPAVRTSLPAEDVAAALSGQTTKKGLPASLGVKSFGSLDSLRGKPGDGKQRFKLAGIGNYTKWDEAKEMDWFIRRFPQVPLYVLSDLKEIHRNGGVNAWGVFQNAAVYIAEHAGEGTVYHEAFHVAFHMMLSESERAGVLAAGRKKYGTVTDKATEEALADAFMYQVMSKGKRSVAGRIGHFFKRLWSLVEGSITGKLTVDELFYRIDEGYYADRKFSSAELSRFTDVTRFRVPGFDPVEEAARVSMINSLLFQGLDKLRTEYPAYKKLTDAEMLNEVGLQQAYLSVAQSILDDYNNPEKAVYHDRLEKVLLSLIAVQEDGSVKLHGLYHKAVRALQRDGIRIYEEEADTGDSTLEGWQTVEAEENPYSSMSQVLKRQFNRIPLYQEDGSIARDDLDINLTVDGDALYATLLHHLSGMQDAEEMMERLQALQATYPEMKGLIELVSEGTIDRTRLFTALSKAHVPQLTVDMQDKVGKEGKVRVARVMDANRQNIHQLFHDEWKSNYGNPAVNKLLSNGKLDTDKVAAWGKRFNQIEQDYKAGKDIIPELVKLLSDAGFILEERALRRVARKDFAAVLSGSKSIATLVTAIRNHSNPFEEETDGKVRKRSELTTVRNLARIAAKANLHRMLSSHRNFEGKTIYAHVKPSFVTRLFDRLKGSRSAAYLAAYRDNWYFKRNYWLEQLATNAEFKQRFTFNLLSGYREKEEGKGYVKMSDKELEIMGMSVYFNNGNAHYGYYKVPVLADSSNLMVMQASKLSVDGAVDRLYQVALQEAERIDRYKAGDTLAMPRGGRFLFLKFLNGENTLKGGVKFSLDAKQDMLSQVTAQPGQVKEAIKRYYAKKVFKELDRLTHMGILSKQGENYYNAALDSRIDDVVSFVAEYVFNHTLATTQIVQLTSIDPAYYKTEGDFQKRNKQIFSPKQHLDTSKSGRTYKTIYLQDNELVSPLVEGISKSLEMAGVSETDRLRILAQYGYRNATRKIKGQEVAVAETSDGSTFFISKKVNQTDAQTYITLDRARKILEGSGQWTQAHEAAWPAITAGEASEAELGIFLQPIKPFYYGHRTVGENIMPIQHKNSEFVLLPQLAAQSKKLSKLLSFMQDSGVDSASFESVVKVGGYGQTTVDTLNPEVKKRIPMNFADDTGGRKMRSEFRGKSTMDLILSGDRTATSRDTSKSYNKHDLSIGDVVEFYDGTGRTAKVKVTKAPYNITEISRNTWSQLEGWDVSVYDRLNSNYEQFQFELLTEPVIHDMLNSDYGIQQENPQHFQDAEILFGTQMRKLIFSDLPLTEKFNALFDRFQQLLRSDLQESNGQVAEKLSSVDNVAEMLLQGARERELGEFWEDAMQVQEGKTRLPFWNPLISRKAEEMMTSTAKKGVTKQKIKGMAMVQVSNFGFDGKLQVKINKETGAIEHFEVYLPAWSKDLVGKDITEVPEELRKLIGFRIPTEDKYSMVPMLVKGFLPSTAGNSIMLPAEITTIAGSDFDIDKLYIMIPAWKTDKDGKLMKISGDDRAGRDNEKIDIMWQVLTSPEVAPRLFNPGGFENLKAQAEQISKWEGTDEEDLDITLPETHTLMVRRNMAGVSLKGIFSNHATSHALLQRAKVAFTHAIRFNGSDKTFLDRFEDKLDNTSRHLSSLMAAAMDNAKDPVAGSLNINEYTADVLAAIVRTGHSLDTALYFINQPIIKEYVARYFNEGADYGAEQKAMEGIQDALSKRDVETKEYEGPVNFNDADMQQGIRSRDPYTTSQYVLLDTFLKYRHNNAQPLADLVQSLRSDTKGMGPTLADTEVFLDKINAVLDSPFLNGHQKLFEEENNPYPSNLAFLEEGIRKPLEIIKQYLPWMSEGMLRMKAQIAKYKNISGNTRLTADEINAIHPHYLSFLLSGHPVWQGKDIASLRKTLPKRLLTAKQDPTLKDIPIIKHLKVELDESGEYAIRFANTGTTQVWTQDSIRDSWEYLMDGDYTDLGMDLAYYALSQSGFLFTPHSYAHLLPVSFYTRKLDNGQSLNDYLEEEMREVSTGAIERFLPQLYAHTVGEMKLLPLLTRHNSRNIVADKGKLISVEANSEDTRIFHDKKGFTPYLRMQYQGQWYVLREINSGTYSPVHRLGSRQSLVEYDMHQDFPGSLLSVNNVGIAQDDNTLYQLSADTPGSSVQDNALLEKLQAFLSAHGIRIEAVQSMHERYHKSAIAVADLTRRMIYYQDTAEGRAALPEEAAHFAIEMLPDSPFVRRLLQLAGKSKLYEQVVAEYGILYNQDEQRLLKETAGKLLHQQFLQQAGETVPASLLGKIWQQVRSLLKRISISPIEQAIEQTYGKLSKDVVMGRWSAFDPALLDKSKDVFYELSRAERLLSDSITMLKGKVAFYRNKGAESFLKREQELISRLETRLENQQIVAGIADFMKGVAIEVKLVDDKLRALLKVPEADRDIRQTAALMRQMRDYTLAFLPHIEQAKKLLTVRDRMDSKPARQVMEAVTLLESQLRQVDEMYYAMGVPLVGAVLKQYSSRTDVDWEAVLQKSDRDISWFTRWTDSLAESGDDVLMVIDKMVKLVKRKGYRKSLETHHDLLEAQHALEKAGVKDTGWLYERDSKGKLTGNMVEAVSWKAYQQAKATQAATAEHLSEQAAARSWAVWFQEHAVKGKDGTTMPNPARYGNTQYAEIMRHPAKKAFYELVMAKKKAIDDTLPEHIRQQMQHRMPQLRKSWLERTLKSKSKEQLQQQIAGLKDEFIVNENDVEYGLVDEQGNPVNIVPSYFTQPIGHWVDKQGKRVTSRQGSSEQGDTFVSTVDTDLSTDVVRSMSLYSYMGEDSAALRSIADVLEVARDLVGKREVVQTASTGKAILNAVLRGSGVSKENTKPGFTSHAYNRLTDYYSMVLYGRKKAKEGTIPFTSVDQAKVIDTFGRYVSLSTLALNVYSSLSNVILGNLMVRIEAFAKEHVNHKNLLWADKTLLKEMPGILNDIGLRHKKSKIGLWMQKAEVLQESLSELYSTNQEVKTKAGQLTTLNTLFGGNKGGEYQMQARMALAVADNVTVKDAAGKEYNLYEAHEVVNGRLKMKEGLTLNGKPFHDFDFDNYVFKVHHINNRLHGIYNENDKNAMQQWSLARAAIMFRKFIKPGINRRYGRKEYNEEAQAYVEGNYITFGNLIKNIITDISHAQAHWGRLSLTERANVMRAMGEIAFTMMSAFLGYALMHISDDDEDNYLLAMGAYQMNRLYTELRFFSSIEEMIKVVKSPAAGISQFVTITNALYPFNYFNEIKSGPNAGENKGVMYLKRSIPLTKTVERLFDPQRQISYYR